MKKELTPSVHSEFGPSSSPRYINCPGSVSAIRKLNLKEQKASFYAEEGTAAHELGAMCLLNENIKPHKQIGQIIYKDFVIDEEMANAVEVYVDHVFSYREQNSVIKVEERVSLGFVHPGTFGTADAIIINDSVLHVMDYKHGKGVPVEVENNSQAQMYAIGTLMELYKKGHDLNKIEQVILHIIQPRCPHPEGPIRLWATSVSDLRKFSSQVKEAIQNACSDNPNFNPGEKQCMWCDAAATCRHLANHNIKIAQNEFKEYAFNLESDNIKRKDTLTPNEVSYIIEHASTIKNWLKSIMSYAQSELEHGRTIPDFKLVRGRSNRIWSKPAEEIKSYILEKFIFKDEELMTEPEFKSPAQIEKLLGKEKKYINDLVTKPKGKITLAHITDKRQAVEPSLEAEKEFSEFLTNE